MPLTKVNLTLTRRLWLGAFVALALTLSGLGLLAYLGAAWANPALGGECIRESWSWVQGGACQALAASLLEWPAASAVELWLWCDCAFVIVYLSMFALFAAASTGTLFSGKWPAPRNVAFAALLAVALSGGIADWVENGRLLAALQQSPDDRAAKPVVDAIAAASGIKWSFLVLSALATLAMSLLALLRTFLPVVLRVRPNTKVPGSLGSE